MPGEALSLRMAQAALGDDLFAQAVTGRLPALHAALKSLPFGVEVDTERLVPSSAAGRYAYVLADAECAC